MRAESCLDVSEVERSRQVGDVPRRSRRSSSVGQGVSPATLGQGHYFPAVAACSMSS